MTEISFAPHRTGETRHAYQESALFWSRALLHASEVLSATTTVADVLAAVPALLGDLVGAADVRVILAGEQPATEAAWPDAGVAVAALAEVAVRDGHSRFYGSCMDLTIDHPGLAGDVERLGWQAAACVPLSGPAGALLLAWTEPRVFYVADRAALATVVHYVGQALRRAGKHDARTAVTETLQLAIRSRLPEVEGYDVAARYTPADDGEKVGGDWYDVIPGPSGRVALVIGDVVGHDMAAAARMGQLRSMLRAYLVDRREPPAAVLRRLDAANHAWGEPTVATAVVAFVDRMPNGGHRLCWSNAGHPPPVLIEAGGGVRALTGNDMLLGARRGAPRHTYFSPLPPGSTVLLHTDGLVEARAEGIDEGLARLYRRLGTGYTGHPRDLLARAGAEIDAVRGDDIAMLAIRIPEAA